MDIKKHNTNYVVKLITYCTHGISTYNIQDILDTKGMMGQREYGRNVFLLLRPTGFWVNERFTQIINCKVKAAVV